MNHTLGAAFLTIALAACGSTSGRAASAAECRASCPEASEWDGKACRYPVSSVQCPDGSRFQGRRCVPTERVATLDVQALIDGTNVGKDKRAVLMDDFKAKQKKLDQVQERLLEEKQQLEAGKLSEAAKKVRREKYERELADLAATYQRYQEELRVKERALTSEILSELREAASRIAERQGFSVIYFDNDVLWTKPGADKAALALKGAPRFDLTSAVMEEMNRGR
jgi:Skp family chaperone for outer membrane proteins